MALETTLDRWVAVGLSEHFVPESASGTTVGSHDLAVWRGADGKARVWENRCPHRGMRLSYGFVRGNRLRCLYHGWAYEGDGACAAIPAHPDLTPPKTIKTTVFDSAEEAAMIWVTASGNVVSPEFPGDWIGCRSVAVDASFDIVTSLFTLVDFRLVLPDGNGAAKVASYQLQTIGMGNFLIRPYGNAHYDALLCAVQPLTDDWVMLHVAASVTGEEGRSGENLSKISDWVCGLRREAERMAGERTPA